MPQDARTRMTVPGVAKVGVSSLMPLERFRMALVALGCRIVAEEPAPEGSLLFGPTVTVEGPFETQLQARWLVSDAKILAHRQTLDRTLTVETPDEVFQGFTVFDPKSGDLIGAHEDGFLFLLDLPEGAEHRDQWGRWVIPVYEEV